MEIVLNVTSIVLTLLTLAPHLPSSHWLVRMWEFPRLQITALMLAILCGYLAYTLFAELSSVSLLLACSLVMSFIYQCIWIVPYTPLYKKEVKRIPKESANSTLSILSSNVYMPNDDFDKLISHVQDTSPDFLVTLESNEKWESGLKPLENKYPYCKACPLDNLYGMHVYSKHKLTNATLHFLVENDVPSIEVKTTIDGKQITLWFVHPKPPSPTENTYAKPRDIELHIVGKAVDEECGPVIVAGDLNDVAWSPTTRHFKKISGLKDPRIGRGFFNTFHAHYPLVKWPLDHVFHSDHFELIQITRLSDIGSDHFPLLTQLALKSS
ncbi:endonuclease/exonuclease/phosphatase family protein [Alteromonas sp. S167]|uniref:endonuclease/exonuclease/phosphatase family protein n=1 Tax=Alteromonas sp. S167 TaxID=3117402 RepID=UPI002FE154B7